MPYSKKEINNYLNILHNYKISCSEWGFWGDCILPPSCSNCGVAAGGFWGDKVPPQGFKICEECGTENGHVLGYFDLKEYDRLHFRKKSVYQRKYYYEKKINQIPNLTGEEKDELYTKLMELDEKVMKKVNKKFSRKRMINVFYIANKMLEEIGIEKTISLNISSSTKKYYEEWWKNYIEIKK